MKDNQAFSIESGGKKIIVTSVRLDIALHELAKRSKLNFRTLLEKAILNEFKLPLPDDPENWSDSFRAMIRKTLEDATREEETDKKRIEILKEEIQHAKAREIATVLAEEEIKRREEERQASHRRRLEEAWAKTAKKRHFTPDKIRRWLPENDRSGDHVDEWEALPNWLSREAGETFTTDEILSFAKRYANGEI